MNIVKKLVISITLFSAALIIVGGVSLSSLRDSKANLDYVMINTIPSIRNLYSAQSLRYSIRSEVFLNSLIKDEKAQRESRQGIDNKISEMKQLLKKYKETMTSDTKDTDMILLNIKNLDEFQNQLNRFWREYSTHGASEVDNAFLNNGYVAAIGTLLSNGLNDEINYNNQLADQLQQQNNSNSSRAFFVQLSVIIIALCVAGSIALLSVLYVRKSLKKFSNSINEINSSLDLTIKADSAAQDEIGSTASVFNQLMDRIAGVMREVKASSDTVSLASKEIASGNSDLSARTEEQASSLEQTAASVTEIAATIKHNVDNTVNANQLGQQANEMVEKSHHTVEKMLTTMNEISDGSEKISKITALIEGIAFQTNILALNAAVEAARAGEQGRGFAVVASEVRSLSHRSSSAAKDIKELIELSINSVRSGAEQVVEVKTSMEQVRQSIHQVASVISEVSLASEEQKRGIDQVNIAVTEMEAVTQQNASMVQQVSSAAESLSEQAQRLQDEVSAFTLARV
jgi:methyl-accepting chemotaxis protein